MDQNSSSLIHKDQFDELAQAFSLADCIVTKNYLDDLTRFEPLPLSDAEASKRIGESARVFKMDKLVYDPDENNIQKLVTTYASAAGFGSSLVMIIDSNGLKTDLYLGTCGAQRLTDVSARTKSLYKNFSGNFPGSLREYDSVLLDNEELADLLSRAVADDVTISCVSGVASERDENDSANAIDIQGIEKLIDTMQGNPFTAVLIASLVDKNALADIKAEYEMLYSRLVPFSGSELSFSEGTSDTVSRSLSTSFSESVTKSKSAALSVGSSQTNTHTTSESTSHSDTAGVYAGGMIGGFAFGGNYSHSYSRSRSLSDSTSFGTSHNTTETVGQSDTTGKTDTNTDSVSKTQSSGKSIQIRYENKTVKQLLDRIDLQLERIKQSENFGVFAVAAYFTAKDQMISDMAASAYKSIISGNNTHVENARISTWDQSCTELKKYLRQLQHPVFIMNDQYVTPASIVSSKELAIQMGLPQKSVNGISVIKSAAFGINTDTNNSRSITIGNLFHMGKDVLTSSSHVGVDLDVNSLAMHTFVTGSTGSGKSNAVYMILDKLMNTRCEGSDQNIKFLVIEPAKGEYKERFGMLKQKGVRVFVYGSNPSKTPLLRINPFSFPEDIHVLEHIDRLTELFNMCWPMYAAMPAVLKDSIESAYIECGWDLCKSVTKYRSINGDRLFPTFSDVLKQITIVINRSAYSSDSKGDYTGALCTRIKSLTNGIFGQIFGSDELSDGELFDENVIVDLSRVGSSETKAMIMGLLVIRMQEYRMSSYAGSNQPLKHITVLEEAHNILRSSSAKGSGDAAGGLAEKSVEMLANAIAEMRTYGEGFVIVDQSPGLLDSSAIRNTNTKIILRLPDKEDRELVGKSASLNDSQIVELSKLPTGVAAVFQNNWTEPVLCHVSYNDTKDTAYLYKPKDTRRENDIIKQGIISYILLPFSEKNSIDHKYSAKIREAVFGLDIPSSLKVELFTYIASDNPEEIQEMRGNIVYAFFNSEISLERSYSRDINVWHRRMLQQLEPNIDTYSDEERIKILTLILRENFLRTQSHQDEMLLSQLKDRLTDRSLKGSVL